uniref:Uncharacterized protein n=1 Tax=Tetradesmus obliquus TaxID=3088 RepID=A0A383WMU0_TETOB|eukprot:jgi/Sobl393_1/14233/SZX78755.1
MVKSVMRVDAGGSNRRFGPAEQQQQQQQQQQQPCPIVTKYIPSAFEQSWLDNVATWQNTFCEAVKAPQQQAWTKIWLDTIKEEAAGSKQVVYDPQVFSRFVTTASCPGQPPTEITTWIEPLAHGLRHPHVLCDMGADVMDRGYLLLTNQADVQALRTAVHPLPSQACRNRTCQAIYMDLGATRWEAAPTSVGQGWFVRSYQARSIEMDRMLLWEAAAISPPSSIFSDLPKDMFHKYQYFNIPAITDYSDASHPVRILKEIAQPGDFVAFKLDIDNNQAENAILKSLREDAAAAVLVDEFFLEYHVNFQPMLRWWAGTEDRNKGLADAFKLFHELRQSGWRAHSWV